MACDPLGDASDRSEAASLSRRSLLSSSARFSAVGLVGVSLRRLVGPLLPRKLKTKFVAKASALSVGGAIAFTDPFTNTPAYLVQPKKGSYAAFSRICTHLGCTVNFAQSSEEFQCPCHGSIYSAKTGSVLRGPALKALPAYSITERDGGLYVEGS